MPLARLRHQFKERARVRDNAHALYMAAVKQARNPGFYTHCGVADTLDGRFDLIVLHVFLVLRALGRAGEPGRRVADRISKVMFDDMDMNLREMGVGDLSVGKRVKAMARAFYGRYKAYDRALDAEGAGGAAPHSGEALEGVLARNVYGPGEPDPARLERLAAYVRAAEAALAKQPSESLLAGEIAFAPAPGEDGG